MSTSPRAGLARFRPGAAVVATAAAISVAAVTACSPLPAPTSGGAPPGPTATSTIPVPPPVTNPPVTVPPPTTPPPISAPTPSGPAPTTGVPAGPVGSNRAALSGVGYADRDAWTAWRGWPVQLDSTWNDARDNSTGQITWSQMDNLYTFKSSFTDKGWKGAVSLGQPMFAQNENVDQCASDAEITTLGDNLKKDRPTGDVFVRLGWEFNGNWYSWSMKPTDPAAFTSCWIRWYKDLKAISPGFMLVWNPNSESSDASLDVTRFWPGRQYVDAAGPDFYAISDNGVLRDPDQLGAHGEPVGIRAWATWVAKQGVPLAVPEWGIRDQSWGSTSPAFIDQIHSVFVAAAKSPTGLAFEAYFDGSTAFDCQFSIHDTACGYGRHQAAADEYQALWAGPYATS